MLDYLSSLSGQPLTFLTILTGGLIYIILSGILGAIGGIGEGDVDGDGTHDGDNDTGHDTISIFSPRIIAIFAVGFGAAGVLATHYGADVIVATASGLASGGGLGGLALFALRMLHSQQASSEIAITDALNLTGTTTIAIPTVGFGEVSVTVKGQYMTYSASSRGTAIPRNTLVKVVATEGTYLIVTPLVS